jgi:Zn-finger nucleic acid-binding protein
MADKPEERKGRCSCPYCDADMGGGALSFCTACKIEIPYCPKCSQPVARDREICPHCGADLRGEATEVSK